jgi:hypothetical protein
MGDVTDPKVYTAGVTIETNQDKGKGSLGGFAKDKTGRPVLVTASHVLFPGFKTIANMQVFSPDYSSTCCNGDPIGKPVFDRNQAAHKDEFGGWWGGYQDGTWTGGFNWVVCQVRGGMGANVLGHASEVDCAMATLDPGIQFHNVWEVDLGNGVSTIPIKGAVSDGLGVAKGPEFDHLPNLAQYVRIYSRNSRQLRWGTIVSTTPDIEHGDDPDHLVYRWAISDSTDKAAGSKANVDQFLFLPRPTPLENQSLDQLYSNGEELTIDEGDSGSWVINSDNLVVGMLIRAGDPKLVLAKEVASGKLEVRDVRAVGVITPIKAVLDHLEISIPAAPGGWSATAPSADTTRVFVLGPRSTSDARRERMHQLRAELRHSTRGRLLLGKIDQHRREVRRLLTTVRPVAATWRAYRGADFFHHCVRSVERPEHEIPSSIDGVTREALVRAMLPVLLSHASPALRADLQRYAELLAPSLLPIAGILEVPTALARVGARQ